MGEFRCGESGAWIDCLGGSLASSNAAPAAVDACTTACASLLTASIPADYLVAGRVVTISVWGEWKASTTAQGQQLGVYYGTNSAESGDTLIGTLPTALSVSNTTGFGFHLIFQISCLTTGTESTAGTISGEGMVTYSTSATATDNYALYTGGSQSYTTTTAENIYVFPIWTTSNAGNLFETYTGQVTAGTLGINGV
jgi:hypothetical protein